MSYPIKTLSQLPLILKGFRKEKRLTQAAMGEKLGITQQSYAAFEANPSVATLDRLFVVLRLLDVEISLDQMIRVSDTAITPSVRCASVSTPKASSQKNLKVNSVVTATKTTEAATAKASRIVAPTRKKESW